MSRILSRGRRLGMEEDTYVLEPSRGASRLSHCRLVPPISLPSSLHPISTSSRRLEHSVSLPSSLPPNPTASRLADLTLSIQLDRLAPRRFNAVVAHLARLDDSRPLLLLFTRSFTRSRHHSLPVCSALSSCCTDLLYSNCLE